MAAVNLPCLKVAGKQERPWAGLAVYSRQSAVQKITFWDLLLLVAGALEGMGVALVR
jgi:hypothetical protein